MQRSTRILILGLALVMWTGRASDALAYDETYESCSKLAWANIETVEDYVLDVQLVDSKRGCIPAECDRITHIYQLAREKGPDTALLTMLVAYAKCARDVRDRAKTAKLSTTEVAYRDCAYASASRVAVLDAIRKGDSISATKSVMGSPNYDLIDTLYRVARERSELRAAWDSGEALRDCVSSVVGNAAH